jgi:DNA-binding transcriptional LysR family regulator
MSDTFVGVVVARAEFIVACPPGSPLAAKRGLNRLPAHTERTEP